jgi:translation initiation factor IF-2
MYQVSVKKWLSKSLKILRKKGQKLSKNLKLNIKNTQLADALNLDHLKAKLGKKKSSKEDDKKASSKDKPKTAKIDSKEKETQKEITQKETHEAIAKDTVVSKPALTSVKAEPAKKEPKKEDVKKPLQKKASEEKSAKTNTPPKPPAKSQKPTKGYQDLPPLKRNYDSPSFDSRSRQGLVSPDEGMWKRRRRRPFKQKKSTEDTTIRPKELHLRLPITLKQLSAQMKLKASQLMTYLFSQGMTITVNDVLDDEDIVKLIGQEFDCDITIDTSQEERLRITDKTLQEEVSGSDAKELQTRPAVIAFMGHVDHGKTSLIDAIRKSNLASQESGAITQHIGAFQTKTSHGLITILDTPGHEAFSAMRGRGANVTDIVVLVVAGDEGIKDQTKEAIEHAKAAGVPIVVAINKSDKENFNPDQVYRGLSDFELVPEQWGGSTIMVNCSATTKEGVSELLELIALQADMMELKANPNTRARGTVIESELHKGMGSIATLLVQNGTLNLGDAVVFGHHYGKIKTMINDHGKRIKQATPSTPIEITGLSGLPDAGNEFIVVSSEKEAKQVSQLRYTEYQEKQLKRKTGVLESFLEDKDEDKPQKILPLILRADVQGSLEALKVSIKKIKSKKVQVNVIFEGVGEVSESDIELAKTSKAHIIGLHTRIESHADELLKQTDVKVKLHDIIYHAVDDVKKLMVDTLDKLPKEEDRGKALVQAIFKASRLGKIAGCIVTDGIITRNDHMRVRRGKEVVWSGKIASLKREKEDTKEVKKGLECGILLEGFNGVEKDDVLEAFEITYYTQEL